LLAGKNIVITGASSGLGLASARRLAAEGANITMLARSEAKLLEAAQGIRNGFPDARIREQVLDVSNLDQVRAFAQGIKEPIDVLMNNAGLMGPDFKLSIDGIESQMATNHVGHFMLTKELWGNLEEARGKVVSLSSVVHRRSKLADLSTDSLIGADPNSYDRWQRYADTKLACLLFARELDLRAKQTGSRVKSIAAHPGWAITGLQKNFPNRFDRFAQDTKTGARSQLMAVLDHSLTGGEFIGPKFELWGEPKLIAGSQTSQDLSLSKRLWELTEEIIGTKFLA
jgi:NAD(P)-dependent dehydrogenase (short-subunit alcohol dehydrogenase family)